jgi:uncharacterized membrane protein (UPF0127 family)
MKIINVTKNALLAENAIIAGTFSKRIKGLLGEKDFKKGQALMITPCNSIHTLFMRFPIDVLFVDSDNRIVKLISHMLPFRISGIYFQAHFVIELPAGTLEATSTQKGDRLNLIPSV